MTRPDARRVPRERIDAVVKALYADADYLDWEHLSPGSRTAQYDKWIRAAEIGAVLTQYMTSENARSWIKDGPMKEYGRARRGAGRYAKFGSTHGPDPQQIAAHALDQPGTVVNGSLGVKPFHLVALSSADGTPTYIAWGTAKNVRYLVWACLTHLADNPTHGATVIITETMAQPATAAERVRHRRVAERCSLGLKYFRTTPPKVEEEGANREP